MSIYTLTLITFCFWKACQGSFLIEDYPNPMINSTLWRCGIQSTGPLCDPDSLLNDTERAEALSLVQQFLEDTDVDNNADDGSCKSKGVTIGLAISRDPIISKNRQQNVTDDLMRNGWKLDTRCNKALMLTLSVQPNPIVRFSRYMTTPVFDDELHHVIWTEMHLLRDKHYMEWVRLVLDGIRATIVDRHSMLNSLQYDNLGTASCAGHGFVIMCALFTIIASVALALSAPRMAEECHRRFGHLVGHPAPFPMMRFTNNNNAHGTNVGAAASNGIAH